jgi:hypothetical protein
MKIDLDKYNMILSHLHDIVLNDIINKNGDECSININLLIESIVNLEMFENLTQNDTVNNLRRRLSQTAKLFLEFLDFNNDGKVEIIVKNDDNEYEFGNDVPAFINMKDRDVKQLDSQIMYVLTNLITYFNNNKYNEINQKFHKFYESCKTTNDFFKLNYKTIIANEFDEIISLVITLCIISVPIIDLMQQRVVVFKNHFNDNSDMNVVVTRDDMKNAVVNTYGENIQCIMLLINNIVDQVINFNNVSGCLNKFKKMFTCGSCSKS